MYTYMYLQIWERWKNALAATYKQLLEVSHLIVKNVALGNILNSRSPHFCAHCKTLTGTCSYKHRKIFHKNYCS